MKAKDRKQHILHKLFHRKVVNGINLYEFLWTNSKRIKQTIPDGNCQFRSVAKHLTGSQHNHTIYRTMAVQWMANHKEEMINGVPFNDCVTFRYNNKNIDDYIRSMSFNGEQGDFACLIALSKLLNISFKVIVVQYDTVTAIVDVTPKNLCLDGFVGAQTQIPTENTEQNSNQTLWLLYDVNSAHYDAILDMTSLGSRIYGKARYIMSKIQL
jgi:hypothetical protein